MRAIKLACLLLTCTLVSPVFASKLVTTTEKVVVEDEAENNTAVSAHEKGKVLRDPAEFQKVIDEYKAYALQIKPEVRDEIIAYRKEVAKLNKQKKELYKQLSQVGQEYLKAEQEYKKKLPLNRKNLITLEEVTQTKETEVSK